MRVLERKDFKLYKTKSIKFQFKFFFNAKALQLQALYVLYISNNSTTDKYWEEGEPPPIPYCICFTYT